MKKKPQQSPIKKILIGTIVTLCLTAIAAIIFVFPYITKHVDEDVTLFLKPGLAPSEMRAELRQQAGNFGDLVADLLDWLNVDTPRRGGAYKVNTSATPLEIARRIRNHAQDPVRFTFNNVRTRQQWAEAVAKTFPVSVDSVLAVINDPEFCAQHGTDTEKILTRIFPDTYEFYWTSTPQDIFNALAKYHSKFWTDERRAQAEALGLTPEEISIVASIAEEETNKSDERGKVGQLYINRYKMGMRLQADPTVKYAIGDFTIRRITGAMTRHASPYNTYYSDGLPPGPIRIATKATIQSILDSEPHNYIYMCAKEDFSGYHNFATNFADHQTNARRYQQELNRRGIH